MSVSQFERYALLFRMHVEISPKTCTGSMSTFSVVDLLKKSFDSGRAVERVGEIIKVDDEQDDSDEDANESDLPPQPGENVILVKKFEIDQHGTATLLVHYGDNGAAEQMLMDKETLKTRGSGKKENEVEAVAAHLVIATSKTNIGNNFSNAVLEKVPSLPRSRIVRFLNMLLRKEAQHDDLRYIDNDTGEKLRYHPKFSSYVQKSHLLERDLEDGKLTHVQFVKYTVEAGFDEPALVKPVSTVISYKLKDAPTGNAAIQAIQKLRALGKQHHYDEMLLKVTQPKLKKSISPRFSTELADALDTVYARNEKLEDFENVLEACPDEVVPEVRDRLKKILGKQNLWK